MGEFKTKKVYNLRGKMNASDLSHFTSLPAFDNAPAFKMSIKIKGNVITML